MSEQKTFEQYLDEWIELSKEVKRLVAREKEMRAWLFASAFPNPTEGTNKLELADGRILKADHKIYRSVDNAVAPTAIKELTALQSNSLVIEELFKVKYDLGVGAYKKLEGDAKAIADKAVTSKPGSPSMEVI